RADHRSYAAAGNDEDVGRGRIGDCELGDEGEEALARERLLGLGDGVDAKRVARRREDLAGPGEVEELDAWIEDDGDVPPPRGLDRDSEEEERGDSEDSLRARHAHGGLTLVDELQEAWAASCRLSTGAPEHAGRRDEEAAEAQARQRLVRHAAQPPGRWICHQPLAFSSFHSPASTAVSRRESSAALCGRSSGFF